MAGFSPKNDDHAVVEVTFNLELDKPIGAAVSQFALGADNASLPWAKELPAASAVPGIQFAVNAGGQPAFMNSSGAQFAFLRPNGLPTWMLRLTGNFISVECHLYTRWAEVGGTAIRLFGQALDYVRKHQPDISVRALNFQVVDEFITDDEQPDFKGLLKDQSVVGITPFRGGALWHCFLGWFDEAADPRVLQNLNIQSTGTSDPEDFNGRQSAPFSVKMTHLQIVRSGDNRPLDEAGVASAVNEMHERNKQIVLDLLNPAMAERISLRATVP